MLGHSKRLMSNVIWKIDAFYSHNFYYGDTDSARKNHWYTLVAVGYVANSLGLGQHEYGTLGIFYSWFLAPKIWYCLVIKDYEMISAKRNFKKIAKNIG